MAIASFDTATIGQLTAFVGAAASSFAYLLLVASPLIKRLPRGQEAPVVASSASSRRTIRRGGHDT